jgi:predicted SAM-dependent methyltransferase
MRLHGQRINANYIFHLINYAAGGVLMVSVPDLAVLARLFVSDQLSLDKRYIVMRMIYGGQTDPYDFHKGGFDFEILKMYLGKAGFCGSIRVADFKLFNDTSIMEFEGVNISINVIARACSKEVEQPVYRMVDRYGSLLEIS